MAAPTDDVLDDMAADLTARLTAMLAAVPFDDPAHTVPKGLRLRSEYRKQRREADDAG